MTPAEPGWEVEPAEFSTAGLLLDPEPSREDYDAGPAGEDFEERRRHLRLVREQARRRANGRRLLVSAGIGLLGIFCLGLVTFHVLIAENQFTLDRLTQTAATEQASTTDEVNRNITEIARISNDFASGAKKSANSSESLSQLAVELDSLVSRFKVEDGEGSGGMRGHATRVEKWDVVRPARVALNMN